jgi:hypothetical protein
LSSTSSPSSPPNRPLSLDIEPLEPADQAAVS